MCRVLSALSVESDSALLRNGWESLHLAQRGEPTWKPSTKRALRLKPLLIVRTLLSGILITVTFFSKKVTLFNCRGPASSAGGKVRSTQRPVRCQG